MASKLNALSGMPQMRAAFSGWKSLVTLEVVTNAINADGLNIPTTTQKIFKGTVQPLSVEQLRIKPESQRSNEWLQLHFENGATELNDGDQIIYKTKSYKINGKKDYSLNNFIEYHAMEVLS